MADFVVPTKEIRNLETLSNRPFRICVFCEKFLIRGLPVLLLISVLLTSLPAQFVVAPSSQEVNVVFVTYAERSSASQADPNAEGMESTHLGDKQTEPKSCRGTTSEFSTFASWKYPDDFPVPVQIKTPADPKGNLLDNQGRLVKDRNGNPISASSAKLEVQKAFNTIDDEEHPAGGRRGSFKFFTYVSSGGKITVEWGPVDGPGGAIALTTVAYDTAAKRIASANIENDSDDPWAIVSTISCNSVSAGWDIFNMDAHEAMHTIGVGHASATSTNRYLTMYPSANWIGETHKRTLGTGDRKAVDAIYP